MDTKNQMARKSKRQIMTHSLSPNHDECGSREMKVTGYNNFSADSGKNTSITSLPPALTKDQKYPRLKSATSTASNISVRNELLSSEKVKATFGPLKPTSSEEPQNLDIYLQKRPIRLAPLNLPEEVRAAQLKKMKDEVFLKNYKTIDQTVKALNDRPIKKDTLKKVPTAENYSEEVKVKNRKSLKDCRPKMDPLSGDIQETRSRSSKITAKGGHVHCSVPKLVNTDLMESSVKRRFNQEKSHDANPSIIKQVNKLDID